MGLAGYVWVRSTWGERHEETMKRWTERRAVRGFKCSEWDKEGEESNKDVDVSVLNVYR